MRVLCTHFCYIFTKNALASMNFLYSIGFCRHFWRGNLRRKRENGFLFGQIKKISVKSACTEFWRVWRKPRGLVRAVTFLLSYSVFCEGYFTVTIWRTENFSRRWTFCLIGREMQQGIYVRIMLVPSTYFLLHTYTYSDCDRWIVNCIKMSRNMWDVYFIWHCFQVYINNN